MATKAEKLLKKGRAQEKKGNHEKAWKLFRSACDAAKHDPEVWLARAGAAEQAGMRDDAIEALFYLADMYARSGFAREAIETAERVLALDKEHGDARRLKGMLERRRPSAEIEQASESEPEAEEPEAEEPKAEEPESKPAEPEAEEPEAEEPEPKPAEPEAEEPEPKPADPEPEEPKAEEPKAEEPEPEPATIHAGPPQPDTVASEIAADDHYEVVIDRAATDGGAVARPVPRERTARSVSQSYKVGRVTGRLAIAELELGELLPGRRPRNETGEIEIDLDDEPETDVVRAVAATLTTSPLLSELDSDLVRQLIECGKLCHAARDELIFDEGDPGTSLYLVLKGKVSVECVEGEQIRRLAVLKAGAFFGEMALLTNAPRSAAVRAMTAVDLLEVSREAVRALVDRDARILKLLMRFFRARLVATLLATSPLFQAFERERKRDLITRFRLRELKPGYLILKTGERSDGLYLVLAGQLQVFTGGAISDPQVLGTLGPGDVFGEMSLLDGTGAMANVRTQGRSWVLLLPREDFASLVAEHPLMLEELAKIADRRRSDNQELLARGRAPAPATTVKPV